MNLSYLRLQWRGGEDGRERVVEGQTLGWVLDVPWGLSKQQTAAIAKYVLVVQKQRYHAMMPGLQKDALGRAIRLLERRRIKQNIAGLGDRVLLDAYKRNEDSPIFSFPGALR